jgi:cytochrome c-type biogenesis protein CcmH/NrfF
MNSFANENFATCMLIMLPVQLIRDEIHAGKTDKEIFKKLEEDFGETVLYAPKFDLQTAGLWLSPVSLRT